MLVNRKMIQQLKPGEKGWVNNWNITGDSKGFRIQKSTNCTDKPLPNPEEIKVCRGSDGSLSAELPESTIIICDENYAPRPDDRFEDIDLRFK